MPLLSHNFLKDFIYLFLERGEREKHQCMVASWAPPTGDLACNPGVCPDWESNQRPFGSQASAQSTEPHHPGFLSHINSPHRYRFVSGLPILFQNPFCLLLYQHITALVPIYLNWILISNRASPPTLIFFRGSISCCRKSTPKLMVLKQQLLLYLVI